MLGFTNLVALLGEYFYFVLIACIELIIAIILIGVVNKNRSKKKRYSVESGIENIIFDELDRQSNEAYIVLRNKDAFPVFSAGNIKELLGMPLEKIQEDITCVLPLVESVDSAKKFWEKYHLWNGSDPLSADIKFKNGEWIKIAVYRCKNEKHDLFSIRKITSEKISQENYEKKLEKASSASQFKTSFLFRMSHEIRTPMNGIAGMLTLAEGKLEKDHPAMQYLAQADELSNHLLALINDILDMSRIEAGKVKLELKPFSLKSFGNRIHEMFSETLENKHIHYAVNFEEMTVDRVIGDELRIGQVIINFLSNAVKFTEKGEVIVTFRQMLLKNDSVDIMIRVHDTGIGMKSEFISKIFKPFEQEDDTITRRFGGTGLGMAISDQLINLMGGQIVVDSLPGKGSDFTVFLTLPLATDEESDADEQIKDEKLAVVHHNDDKEKVNKKCRILMAEDNEINAMISIEILKEKGAEVDIAVDGRKAIEQFERMPENYYDIILMDIQMPVLDGRAAAKEIRKLDKADAKTIPIYALSADAFVEDRRLSKESGMNGHFSKPIDFDLLWQTIQEYLNR